MTWSAGWTLNKIGLGFSAVGVTIMIGALERILRKREVR